MALLFCVLSTNNVSMLLGCGRRSLLVLVRELLVFVLVTEAIVTGASVKTSFSSSAAVAISSSVMLFMDCICTLVSDAAAATTTPGKLVTVDSVDETMSNISD